MRNASSGQFIDNCELVALLFFAFLTAPSRPQFGVILARVNGGKI
jgi:hypothetical protein